jgi:hypothetical protein
LSHYCAHQGTPVHTAMKRTRYTDLLGDFQIVVGLENRSNVSPRPHHYLVHATRMLRYKGTDIIHLQKIISSLYDMLVRVVNTTQ